METASGRPHRQPRPTTSLRVLLSHSRADKTDFQWQKCFVFSALPLILS